jgi:voltage-gated potassium channel
MIESASSGAAFGAAIAGSLSGTFRARRAGGPGGENQGMESRPPPPRAARYVQRHFERRGLRPRAAASIIAVVWLAAVLVFGLVEYLVDRDTFDTVWLALWWATQTVTTVGYGDVVPGSGAGKALAAVLMIGGLSLFAVITGVITSVFVARAQAEARGAPEDPIAQGVERISGELEAVREELARLSGDRGGGA